MKFFTALFSILALGVIANPVVVPDFNSLETRGSSQAQINFQAVSAVHSGLKPGDNHAFILKLKVADQGFPEMNKLTEDIGGSHVMLIVGKVPQGSKDTFEATVYDLVFDKTPKSKADANNSQVSMAVAKYTARVGTAEKPTSSKLQYLGPVDGRKVVAIEKKGDAIVAAQNNLYNLDNFNCDTFARALYKQVSK